MKSSIHAFDSHRVEYVLLVLNMLLILCLESPAHATDGQSLTLKIF